MTQREHEPGYRGIQPFAFEMSDGQTQTSPFQVVVTGHRGEKLGIGELIGGMLRGGEFVPQITLYEPLAPGNVCILTGDQCQFWPLDDLADRDEIVVDLAGAPEELVFPLDYLASLVEFEVVTDTEPHRSYSANRCQDH